MTDSDSTTEVKSPGLSVRSHLRLASGQGEALPNPALRRPGLAPLTGVSGSERNRSSSESYLQATQNSRSKRHGYVTKKTPDLARLDELQTNRNSFHLRGQSHGSVLRDKYNHDYRNGNRDAGSLRPNENERGTFVRRLSSLPEDKRESVLSDGNTEGAKGILYALHQVQPVFEALIPVIKDGAGERSSPEGIYRNAVIQLEHLDQKLLELQTIENTDNNDINSRKRVKAAIFHACNASIIAYRHVGNLLLRNMKQLVVNGESRYLRSLMLHLYGSLVESRNACKYLGKFPLRKPAPQPSQRGVPVIREDEQLRTLDYTITSTERSRPERRWRNGAPILQGLSTIQIPSASAPSGVGALHLTNRSRSNSRTAVLHTPGFSTSSNTPRSGQSSAIPGTPLIRSRSNSAQAGNYTAEHPNYLTATRVHQPETAEHAALFERVFLTLNSSVDQGLRTIPILKDQFTRRFQAAELQKPPSHPKILDLWFRLTVGARTSLEICDLLKRSMATFRLHEPDIHHAKNFWRLCRKFGNALTSLFTSIKEATVRKLITSETVAIVHPVYKSSKEAIKMIHDSPWKSLLTTADLPGRVNDNDIQPSSHQLSRSPSYTYSNGHQSSQPNGYQSPAPPATAINTAQPTSTMNGTTTNGYHSLAFHSRSRATSNASTTATATSSPYMTSIPATPLSAALGPAAMATVPVSTVSPALGSQHVNGNGNVPSTPGILPGTFDRSFQGDIYQRADTLLSIGGTAVRGR